MIHRTYAKLLRHHSSGHALYFPVSTEQIRPGSLGFFDGFGVWHSLSYDVKSVEWPMRPFAGDLRIVTHKPYGVEEFTSEGIKNVTVGIGLSESPIPQVTVGGNVENDTRSKSTAILQCGPITLENLASGVSDLKTWGKDNAKHILEKETLTREHGFFIVTAIRKTKWCKLKCWSINTRTVSPMLFAGPAQVGAKTEIHKGETISSGWVVRPADDDSTQPETDYVIFVEGFLFISRILGTLVQASTDRVYRDGEDEENIRIDENTIESCGTIRIQGDRNRYDIQCETWLGIGTH